MLPNLRAIQSGKVRTLIATSRLLSTGAKSTEPAAAAAAAAGGATVAKGPWGERMPAAQFERMKKILAAPSPVGHEGAMTFGVLKPMIEQFMPKSWKIHQFKGHAGLIVDTHPDRDDLLKVMVVGHADKIRMQVRHIGTDGKVWVDSDSFLPMTLIGNEVLLFSEDPANPGAFRRYEGGTIEAVGAIHFASPKLRSGDAGIKKEQLYLELHVHGDEKNQIEKLGIRPGDPILLDRPIKPGFMPNTFTGAYLDNGLGCFVTEEVARLVAEQETWKKDNVRCLFTFATYEEIGRLGSRVMASQFKPDVLMAVDVNHDYVAAPGVGDKKYCPLAMGKGFTISHGSIVSNYLNGIIETAATASGIPFQRDVVGTDTGTDAMAAVLGGVDAAATSIGFPIRNMHTVSEAGHTGDVLASVHVINETIKSFQKMNGGKGAEASDFATSHTRLDQAPRISPNPAA